MVLGNYEFFAGTVKEFEVWVTKRYPPVREDEWMLLGKWQARNTRQPQSFSVPQPALDGIYTRFVKIRLLSHYGNEYYCALSVVKMFGKTMIDDFAEEEESKKATKENKMKGRLDEGTVVIDHIDEVVKPEPEEECSVLKMRREIKPCPLGTLFNSTCPKKTSSNKVHALQLFKRARSLQRVIPLRDRPRPVFPIPMKPIRRTIIQQLICFNKNPLQHQMCSSQFKTVKVLQRAYFDPDRITISDLNGSGFFDGATAGQEHQSKKKHNDNIFKSLSDRLGTLEKAHTKHALILQAALHRFQYQLDQIMSEIDMTDTAARGLESYRDRLQRFLLEYLEERMDRVEDHLDKDRAKQDSSLNYVLIVFTLVNFVLWISVYFQRRQTRPYPAYASATNVYISPPVSPMRDQSVPRRGDSLERVEQALMDASPLLLFDPETNIVDGIYTTPSPAAIHSEEDHKLHVDS